MLRCGYTVSLNISTSRDRNSQKFVCVNSWSSRTKKEPDFCNLDLRDESESNLQTKFVRKGGLYLPKKCLFRRPLKGKYICHVRVVSGVDRKDVFIYVCKRK